MSPGMFTIKVWGDRACFTRPESKVERLTYPVMTPGAATGVLRAIYGKPQFRWRVHSVAVLSPIRTGMMVRRELGKGLPGNGALSVRGAARISPEVPMLREPRDVRPGDPAYSPSQSTLRSTTFLVAPAYLIEAEVVAVDHGELRKHAACFQRRMDSAEFFHRPSLGLREFAAYVDWPDGDERPLDLDLDLGPMFWGMRYRERRGGGAKIYKVGLDGRSGGMVRGDAVPTFFGAQLRGGVMAVPDLAFPTRDGVGDEGMA